MTDKIIILLITAVLLFVGVAAVPTAAVVYGQAGAPTDIEVVDSETIERQIVGFFSNARLVNYTLFADGNATYTFEYAAPGPSRPGIGTTVEVHVDHRYTPENGYIFNSTGVYTPEGRRLIIETQQQ